MAIKRRKPNKRNLTDKIKSHIENGELNQVILTAQDAFRDPRSDEETLAWLTGIIYESDIPEGFHLIPSFVDRFPESLHLMRVYLADLWARQKNYDMATHESRIYLRRAKDSGVIEKLDQNPIVKEGVSMALLLLTSGYTEIGSRSYSLRVINYALKNEPSSAWQDRYEKEIGEINRDLRESPVLRMDEKWEDFYKNGAHAQELHKMSLEKDFQTLAQRIQTINGKFQSQKTYALGIDEIFMLVNAPENQTPQLD